MKYTIVTLLIGYFVTLFFATPVFAHTLKIDGNIGVNLHIDPDDSPRAGRESKFFVDIQDKTGRFNPNNPGNCDCIVTIVHNDEVIKTLPVVAGGAYAQIRFTFPTSGVYKVTIEGKPKGEGVPFQAFHTNFEYFVQSAGSAAQTQANQNSLQAMAPYVALIVGIAIILLWI